MNLFLALMMMFSHGFYNTQSADKIISIVQNVNNTSNTIWYKNTLDLEQDFNLSFEIFLGSPRNQGDGAALIFSSNQTDPTQLIGGIGGAIGSLDIKDSLVLEFDTYFNGSGSQVDSDQDTGIKFFQSNGHVAVVETNDLNSKHKEVRHSARESLANGQFRTVQASWDAQSQVMTFIVQGYDAIVHTVDIEKVFSSRTEVMFGYASANGAQKTNAQVETTLYPHQALIEHKESLFNDDTMTSIYTLSKSISNDTGNYNTVYFDSNSFVSNEVIVNGQMLIMNNGDLDLSSFNDETLEIAITTKKENHSEIENLFTYQGQSLTYVSEWPEIEVPPIDPPVDPPIDPPVNPPVEPPIDPPVNPPVDPPTEPLNPPIENKPVLPPKPEIEEALPTDPVVEEPEVLEPQEEVKVLVKEEKLPNRTHVLVQKHTDSKGNQSNTPNDLSSVTFRAGDKGTFTGNKSKVRILFNELNAIPSVIPQEGYVFIGFYDELGNAADINTIKAHEEYTAHYRSEGVKDTFTRQDQNLQSSLYITVFLLVLRFLLNRDIRRRKEQRHG